MAIICDVLKCGKEVTHEMKIKISIMGSIRVFCQQCGDGFMEFMKTNIRSGEVEHEAAKPSHPWVAKTSGVAGTVATVTAITPLTWGTTNVSINDTGFITSATYQESPKDPVPENPIDENMIKYGKMIGLTPKNVTAKILSNNIKDIFEDKIIGGGS